MTSQDSAKSTTSVSSGGGNHSSITIPTNNKSRYRGGRRKGSKAAEEDKMSSEAIAFMKRLDTSKSDIPTGPAQSTQDPQEPTTVAEQASIEKNGKQPRRRGSSAHKRRASRSSTSPPGRPSGFNVPPLETRLAELKVSSTDHHKTAEEIQNNKADGETSKWAAERDAHRERRMQALNSVEWRKPHQHDKPAEQVAINPTDQDSQQVPSGRRHRARGGRRRRRSTNSGSNGSIPSESEVAKSEAVNVLSSVHNDSNGAQSNIPSEKSESVLHISDYDENEDWADDSEWDFNQFTTTQ